MNASIFLPWFPIILAAGVGGRLLSRANGYGLGLLCALFWLAMVHVLEGTGIWSDSLTSLALCAGALAIIAMGGWAGSVPLAFVESKRSASPSVDAAKPMASAGGGVSECLGKLSAMIDLFDDWMSENRDDIDPWAKFDEFVRMSLYQSCQATHIRPYRLISEGESLVPLKDRDELSDDDRLSSRTGIVGHVVTTGRPFIADVPTQGPLVEELANQGGDRPAWCFPVSRGRQRLGVVVVRESGIDPAGNEALLRAAGGLIGQFWVTLLETTCHRLAEQADPVSGLPNREVFLQRAEGALAESYKQGEPVAVVVLAVERLRELNDMGRWEVADQLIREVSAAVRCKVRSDDRVGRFDGSRFIILFRRVDSELASLIVSQLMAKLTNLVGDRSRWGASIEIRCGVTGSGTSQPELRALVTHALTRCEQARIDGTLICSDLEQAALSVGART